MDCDGITLKRKEKKRIVLCVCVCAGACVCMLGYVGGQYDILMRWVYVWLRLWVCGRCFGRRWRVGLNMSNVCALNRFQKRCFMMFYYVLRRFICLLLPLLCWTVYSSAFSCGIRVTQRANRHFMYLLWIIMFFLLYCVLDFIYMHKRFHVNERT